MSNNTSTTPQNTSSLQTIPLAFGLALTPHLYGLTRLMIATRNQISTAMPRTNLETFKKTLHKDLWNHLARARGAHLNSLEVFPLYASAILAGNVAKLPGEDLGSVAGQFFLARVVYMGLYIGVKNDVLAYARTGAYAWSIAIPMLALWRAGNAMAAEV